MTTKTALVLALLAQSAAGFTKSSFAGNAASVASRAELTTELRCPPSITSARRQAMSMPPFLKKLGLKKPGSKEEEDVSSSSVAVLETPSKESSGESDALSTVSESVEVNDDCEVPEDETETQKLMRQVKEAGTAGVISYALWELGFWALSVPVCLVGYRQVTGHWPDLSSDDDLKKLGAEAFAFVNFARFAVPLRIGLALGTTPWINENIVEKFLKKDEEVCEPAE